jgi:hypothetical protein
MTEVPRQHPVSMAPSGMAATSIPASKSGLLDSFMMLRKIALSDFGFRIRVRSIQYS